MGAHTTARIGKRLTVWMKDGTHFTDKLKEMNDRFLVFVVEGKIERRHIRSLCIKR